MNEATGLCQCGCGEKTKIATRTYPERGWVKGQPLRYINGHNAAVEVTPAEQRFWKFVTKGEGCWIWTGHTNQKGYGMFQLASRKLVSAHRLSYEMSAGEIPAGMAIDHMCHNRSCVNPAHMRPVTNKQNGENRRGPNKNNKSGHRGVLWDKEASKWRVRVGHNGRNYGGRHANIEDAVAEAVKLRMELFTHSDKDKAA